MIVFPNAKINIGLRILRKRADGYHDLESVFYPVQLCDMLEILPSDTGFNDEKPEIYVSGQDVPASQHNLCWKAARLIRERHGISGVRMYLHKKIPSGSGLGGGSSDASFTLMALNEMFACGLNDELLRQYASEIGSDCPFFTVNRPSLVSGRGDIIEPIPFSLAGFHLVLVFPEVEISTAEAYSSIRPSQNGLPLREILQLSPEEWKDKISNRFETVVASRYPEIGRISEMLYRSGAVYASMTGSGSAVYGLFTEDPVLVPDLQTYKTHVEKLSV